MRTKQACGGFSKRDLIAILAVASLLALVVSVMFSATGCNGAKAQRIKCVNNLKNIGLSERIFATDHLDAWRGAEYLTNTAKLSSLTASDFFRPLSNELSTPKMLHCPADKAKTEGTSFTNLTDANVSYFISLSEPTDPEAIVAGDRNLETNSVALQPGLFALKPESPLSWSKLMHDHQGNVAMGDGSVRQYSNDLLRQDLKRMLRTTNWILVP